jgi:hypothetical protein
MLLNLLKNKLVKGILIFSIGWTFMDVIWDWFLSALHFLWMLVHYAFEFFEHGLERLIEHAFHTSPRSAEIIVFYILAAMVCIIAYLILRKLPGWYCSCCERAHLFWHQEKAKAKVFWENQSLALKAKWYTLVVTGSFFMCFLVLS